MYYLETKNHDIFLSDNTILRTAIHGSKWITPGKII